MYYEEDDYTEYDEENFITIESPQIGLNAILRTRKLKLAEFMIREILSSEVYTPLKEEKEIVNMIPKMEMFGFILDFDFEKINKVYFLEGRIE